MSTLRIDPRRGFCSMRALPKGKEGRALCRACQREVPVGRQTFCSNTCVEAWKIRTQPAFVRHLLWKRDAGVCAVCGISTKLLVRKLEALDTYLQDRPFKYQWRFDYEGYILQNQPLIARLAELYISVHRYRHRGRKGIWDADHIVPVIEGGGECDLDNYRTLCCSCHHVATAALRRRRARAKKERAKKQDPGP